MTLNHKQRITGKTETVVIAIAGASGSGKSTLVRALAHRIENRTTTPKLSLRWPRNGAKTTIHPTDPRTSSAGAARATD